MSSTINTPSFIYDFEEIKKKIELIKKASEKSGCKVLYSIKSLPLYSLLEEMSNSLNGFSVSSLFEAKIARSFTKKNQEIHYISSGIKKSDWKNLSKEADYITFNSIEQIKSFNKFLIPNKKYGIRINPELSFLDDERYDPCRNHSKLGISISEFVTYYEESSKDFRYIDGIHFHNNCESSDFSQLSQTFLKIKVGLGDIIKNFKWINLGGGYLFDESNNLNVFCELIDKIKKNDAITEIIIEPGGFFVQSSGRLVSSVIDITARGEKTVAVLDTTVNHIPEAFEYQYNPDILESKCSGAYKYILAGCSCLSGDIFGEYKFESKLEIGSYITFKNVGSYSLVKSHSFNGINLPSIYYKINGKTQKIKEFTFEDYTRRFCF